MHTSRLSYSPALGLWEARAPALVEALLQDPRLGVRPPAQAVPAHLQGRLLGRQFERWLRMRDDAGHAQAKARLSDALRQLPAAPALARRQARLALGGGWQHWIWASSVCSMAALLGLPLPDLAAQRQLLTRCRSLAGAIARGAELAAADRACAELLQALAAAAAEPATPVAPALPAFGTWPTPEDEQANRLALIWQSFEAGAALLGQAVAALAAEPLQGRAGSMAAWLPTLFQRPGVILNTRRYARVALQLGEARLRPGDAILLHLSTTPATDLSFGSGPHRCPGRALALAIAAAALEELLSAPRDWPQHEQVLTLPNARIPIFPGEEPIA